MVYMHNSNKLAFANLIQINIDVVFLVLTFFFSYLIAVNFTPMNQIREYYWILIIFIPIWISVMASGGMYDKTTFYYLDRVLRNVIYATMISGLALGSMFFFVKETGTSRLFILVFLGMCMANMFLERCISSKIYKRRLVANDIPRIILVCSSETYGLFVHYLNRTQIRYDIIGVIQVDDEKTISQIPNLGKLDDLGNILKSRVVDEVIFTMPTQVVSNVYKYIGICEQMGITARIVLNINELHYYRLHVSMLGTLPMLTLHTVTLNPVQNFIKRSMDILGSIVGILITLILSLIIVPAILLDTPGPAVFTQKRVGRSGRVFNIYKFRTMSADAESQKSELESLNEHKDGLMFKIKDDPRVTRVGALLRRTSLDELPQFFNVLKGDMSLVGTRPPTIDEYKQYDYEQMRRISIKPGITGMWQTNGRSSVNDFNLVVAMDTQYIDNWSVWLDINILIKTVREVLRMRSAY